MNEFELVTFAFVQHIKTHGEMRVLLMVLCTPRQWLGDTDPVIFFKKVVKFVSF